LDATRILCSPYGVQICDRFSELIGRWMEYEWPQYAQIPELMSRWHTFLKSVQRLFFPDRALCGLQLKIILRFTRELTVIVPREWWLIAFQAALAISGNQVFRVFLFVSFFTVPSTGAFWSETMRYRWSLLSSWMVDLMSKDRLLESAYQSPHETRRLIFIT
jgi:hypothetical protein